MSDWREQTNWVIARNLLDSVSKLTNGSWHCVKCVNSRGETCTKYIITVPDR